MIRRDGQRLLLAGAVTFATHVALREAAAALVDDDSIVDWAAVDTVDSSALSLLLTWRRRHGRAPAHQHVPAALAALAELYGIKDLLAL